MRRQTSRVWRGLRWWLLLIAGMGLAVWLRFTPSRLEPVHEGRRLGQWMHGHPREYIPAVQAIGTNALPYLLAELQVTDPGWLRWAEARVRSLEMGPPWDTAQMHHYYARLALQILDTNAVPALLDAVFARPVHLTKDNLEYEAAFAMSKLASPAAQTVIHQRLDDAMRDPDATTRGNACRAIFAGNFRLSDNPARLVALTRDHEPVVRAAATRAVIFWHVVEPSVLPAISERLADDNAGVRWVAAKTLAACGTNAVQTLPALKAALAAEPSRPHGADQFDDNYPRTLTPAVVRAALWDAMRLIDPKATLPEQSP